MVMSVLKEIKAVIAAGGLRSRAMQPVNVSKAFFPVLNRPAVCHIVDILGGVGVKEAYLSAGRREAEFAPLPGGSNGLLLSSVIEEHPLGTAGCVKSLEDRLGGSTVILVAGDVLFFTREDLSEMLRHHRRTGADLTVGLIAASRKSGLDTEQVSVGAGGAIEEISRIYPAAPPNGGPMTSGIYVMEPGVLGFIGAGGFCDIKEQLVPRLRDAGKKVLGFTHGGYISGARTMEDYLRVNFELLGDIELARDHLCGYREIQKQVWVGRNTEISPSATLVRPLIIGNDVRIGGGASVIGPSIIGDRSVVEAGGFIRESVLWAGSTCPAGLEIEKSLVSGRAFSSENSHCRGVVVLGGGIPSNGTGGAVTKAPMMAPSDASSATAVSRGGQRVYGAVKRAFDIAVAGAGLLLSAPLILLLGIVIKLDSRGPAFFLQTRCGRLGRPFRMIKLRSMVKDAERIKPTIQHLNLTDGPMFKILDDPRETRVGRYLRASKLDELPQLLNVLRGEMSLVGPRPLSMNEMRYNPHWRDARLTVKPGITGLWQIKEKEAHTFHEWIRYDLEYIDQRSLWLDMKILAGTCLKIIGAGRPAAAWRPFNGDPSAAGLAR